MGHIISMYQISTQTDSRLLRYRVNEPGVTHTHTPTHTHAYTRTHTRHVDRIDFLLTRNQKRRKHTRVATVASTKLNSITDLISHALEDGHISTEEFKLVVVEFERYNALKAAARKQQETCKVHDDFLSINIQYHLY